MWMYGEDRVSVFGPSLDDSRICSGSSLYNMINVAVFCGVIRLCLSHQYIDNVPIVGERVSHNVNIPDDVIMVQ